MPFEDVRKICFDYTVHGIETMTPLAAKPFRFAYISGVNGERDQTKNPWIMGDYAKLRVSLLALFSACLLPSPSP